MKSTTYALEKKKTCQLCMYNQVTAKYGQLLSLKIWEENYILNHMPGIFLMQDI